jgi:hypothetical protein
MQLEKGNQATGGVGTLGSRLEELFSCDDEPAPTIQSFPLPLVKAPRKALGRSLRVFAEVRRPIFRSRRIDYRL